jgi:ketosteroid isomerase-like protein
MKRNKPPTFKTRANSASAAFGSGIVQSVQVVTMQSMLCDSMDKFCPSNPANSTGKYAAAIAFSVLIPLITEILFVWKASLSLMVGRSKMNVTTDEILIQKLIDNWAKAVRAKDYDSILAHHSADMVMFDVPPPRESKGLEAYRKTWDLFFSASPEPIAFDIQRMDIVAGADVAFVAALMQCAEKGPNGKRTKTGVSSDRWSAKNRWPMDDSA